MKKQVLTLLVAATLGATAVSITGPVTAQPAQAATTAIQKGVTGVVKVSAAAGTQLYSDSNLTQPIKGKVLRRGSRWQFTQAFAKWNDITFSYDLGGRQYVRADDTTLVSYTQPAQGTFTVNVANHPTWSTTLYNRNFKPISSLLPKSKWKVVGMYQIYYDNGSSDQYLDLGGHQYVKFVNYPNPDTSIFNGNFRLIPR